MGVAPPWTAGRECVQPYRAGTPDRIALAVAADRSRDREIVHRVVDELGFDPVDAGPIGDSWRQQPGTPAYTQDIDLPKLRAALAAADPARVAACRGAANDQVLAYFAQQQQQQQGSRVEFPAIIRGWAWRP